MSQKDTSKILFTGLDGAGKTSIILALKREFDKIAIVKPTMGASRREFSFLGNRISEWDLGGQVYYRSSYLRKFEQYFYDTDVAIYVIDAQNKSRIGESLAFLYDIVDRFNLLNISPPIYVFIHKSDPALDETYLGTLLSDIKDKIEEEEVKYSKMYFYFTTIHDLSSLISVMSEIMLALFPKTKLISDSIESFAEETQSQGIVILDNNSFKIASYYKDEEIKLLLNSTLPYFLTLDEKLPSPEKKNEHNQLTITKYENSFLLRRLLLDEEYSFYLLVNNDGSELKEDSITSLMELLTNFIYSSVV